MLLSLYICCSPCLPYSYPVSVPAVRHVFPNPTISLSICYPVSVPAVHHVFPTPTLSLSICYPVSVSAVHHVFPTPTLSLSICYSVSVAYAYHVSHDPKPHLYVKYFYHLTILSVSCECRVGQYLPFLSRTFRDKFVSINKTIVYMIKKKRQNSENHKFIYVRRIGKEVKERKNRCKNRGFVYIIHNKALFPPYSSHLTS